MAEKLVIIILNSDPQNGAEILEPVYHATIAASMDYHAESNPRAKAARPFMISSKKPTRAASSSKRANLSCKNGATTSSPK